jgi:hypothetical protein
MSNFSEDDYDFSNVPQHELFGSLYYEYMRESETIIREVGNVRQQRLDDEKRRDIKLGVPYSLKINYNKITNHQGIIFEAVMIASLAYAGDKFPGVPWQKLSSSEKKTLEDFPKKASQINNKDYREKNPMLVLNTLLQDPSHGESTLNTWKTKMMPKLFQKVSKAVQEKFLVSGFFQINMSYTQSLLREAFSDWLQANHPEGKEKSPERRGRNTQRDWLNALGALRLRFYCKTFTEAQARMKPQMGKPNGTFYGDRRSFNRACAASVRHFRTLLKLSDKHLPIHFTKGWQK